MKNEILGFLFASIKPYTQSHLRPWMNYVDGSACKLATALTSRFMTFSSEVKKHRGSMNTTITEFGRQNHHKSGGSSDGPSGKQHS